MLWDVGANDMKYYDVIASPSSSIEPSWPYEYGNHTLAFEQPSAFFILQISYKYEQALNETLYKEINKFIGWLILSVFVAVVLNMQSE